MAKHKLYAVYDSKVEAFNLPFFQHTRGQAIRTFSETVNRPDPNNLLTRYPADYSLHELGEYDDQNGSFTNHTAPISLGLATEFKEKPEEKDNLFNMKAN